MPTTSHQLDLHWLAFFLLVWDVVGTRTLPLVPCSPLVAAALAKAP